MLKKLKPTIAVVDSGIGGVSVLRALINKFNAGNYIYFADNLYMPYGKRTKTFVKNRVEHIINFLNQNYLPDLIIIACNTASSSINGQDYANVCTMKFKTDKTILATPLTKKNMPSHNVIADKTLAKQIEKNIFNHKKLKKIIANHIKKLKLTNVSDLILGCTHYELAINIFKDLLPNTHIKNNSDFVLNTIKFDPKTDETTILFLQSKFSKQCQENFYRLIGR